MARSVEDRRNPSRDQERALVLAFQSGDQAAFESIVRTCRPTAERICRRLLINPADVEEAVQETLVRAYQGLPRFNGSYALTAWMARIATNVSLDILRASSRRPQTSGPIDPNMETPSDHQPNGDRDPEEILEQVLEAEEVRGVLASLPERHRTALVLREFEGMSHRHIAEMLDTSPQRVKALIHRAKAGFRRAWGDDHHPERLAAFAPLLTPINWVRRLLGRAPEFDYSTTTAATTTASAVAASPAAHSLVTIASERVSVLATVMLAGTAAFAMQHAPNTSQAREKEAPVVVEMVQAPVEVQEAPAEEPKKEANEDKAKPEAEAKPSPDVEPSPSSPPAEEELEEGVVLAEPDTETAAEPDPKVTPLQAPPAAPPHSASMAVTGFSSEDDCACGALGLDNSSLEGELGKNISFAQTLSGAVRDGDGDAAWRGEVSLNGAAGDAQSSFDIEFTLWTPRGNYEYVGQGIFGGVTQGEGTWTYGFEGSFSGGSGPGDFHTMPRKGTLRVEMTWHADGSPVLTSLTLAAENK
jgi:RNA polymerase sigma-70 factor, ECF subfamily